MTDLLRHPAAQTTDSTDPDDSPLMTVRELARFLRLPLSSTYMVIEQGGAQVVRFGRVIRVRREEAERLAREGASKLVRERPPTRSDMRR